MKRPEQVIHEAVVLHLTMRAASGVAWWHTPNGEARSPVDGAKLKRMGVKPGVADIVGLVPAPRGGLTFFALEIKGPQGRLTKEQRAFLDLVGDGGGCSGWAASLDDALAMLEEWGVLRRDAGRARG